MISKVTKRDVKIKKLDISEVKEMCKLNKIGGNCYDEEAQVLEFFDNEFQPETVYVAKVNDNYVGHLELFEGYKSSIGKFILIRRLIVHPKWRKRGIGRILLDFAIEECKRRKIKNLDLLVEHDNEIALNLYKNLGFKEVGHEIHMRKTIK